MNRAIAKVQRLDRSMRRLGGPSPPALKPVERKSEGVATGRPTYPADVWAPFPPKPDGTPRPQQIAYDHEADELYYGGGAGGGKSDLLLGLGLTAHRRSIIFRRETEQVTGLEDRLLEILGSNAGYNLNKNRLTANIGTDEGGTPVLRRLRLAGMQREGDWKKYQGQPFDLYGFDELPHFTRTQFRTVVGWLRSSVVGQRTRVVGAGNPPLQPEEGWVVDEWAPWLDPKFDGAGGTALPGELRWYRYVAGRTEGQDIEWYTREMLLVETAGRDAGRLYLVPDEADIDEATGAPKKFFPKSRTFLPALVDDNPVYVETGYDRQLDALPEPLRSQLRSGSFGLSVADDRWQVIPTAWVDAAVERWKALNEASQARGDGPYLPVDAHGVAVPLSALGVDPVRGGKDRFALAPRWGDYFGEIVIHPGDQIKDGHAGARAVVEVLDAHGDAGGALVVVDVDGVGASTYDVLEPSLVDFADGGQLVAFHAGSRAWGTDLSGRLRFVNARAMLWWRMREALDPSQKGGATIALPPSRTLRADLTAPRYRITPAGILVEPKDSQSLSKTWGIKQRLGRSTDEADAVLHATYDPPPPERHSTLVDGAAGAIGDIITTWD